MESERRHELETNSLAVWLYQAPDLLRRHANKILIALAAIALLVLLLQYRARVAEQRAVAIRDSLTAAWSGIRQLPGLAAREMDGEQFVSLRDSIEREATTSLDLVLKDADSGNRPLQAQALLAKGQLYWELSRLPEPVGATTRPALLEGRGSDESLKLSADAYQRVLAQFSDLYEPKINATFSLAAIAETQGDLAAAQKHYESLANDEQAMALHRDIARQRIALLPQIEKPLLLGQPSTRPADDATPPPPQAATPPAPATAPSTAPAAANPPATQPR
jgi:hypothetical protein